MNTNCLSKDEYFNETDGLIYCSKCHTPKQTRIVLDNNLQIRNIRCKCRIKAYENEQSEQLQRKQMMKIKFLRANCLQDNTLYDYSFANDTGINPQMHYAHDYVDNWDKMKTSSLGILLWGDVGTGKSFFAGCIANALIDKGIPAMMTNFSRILNTISIMNPTDRNKFIDSLNNYPLLILDDLGIERSSKFALEQVFHVIDSRYRSKLPLIVTTNLTLSEMKSTSDMAKHRIYDRILERCVPIKINGINLREENAKDNIKTVKNIFSSHTA